MSAPEVDLIAAARSGDAAAYGVLYERHAGAARRLARQIVKTPTDVDDVVAETFTRVLYALKGGNGPAEAFRPYLLMAVRRVAIDLVNGQRRQIPTDDDDVLDPGEPYDDPLVADLERSLIRRAFWSLPERWRAVLWHADIEQTRPAEVATQLGMSANAVSVLRRRAREGLSQAYLQLHLSDRARAGCTPTASRLGRYVRGTLSRRQAREVEDHLADCADCAVACAELVAINDTLRGVLAPIVLGGAAAGYLASASQAHGAAAAAAYPLRDGLRGMRLALQRAAEAITHHPIASVGTAAAVAAIAAPSVYFIHPPHGLQAAPIVVQVQRAPGTGAAPPSPGARPVVGGGQSRTRRATATSTARNGGSPRASGKPAPSGSATGSSGISPIPTPLPSPTVSGTAKLSVAVQVSGLLNLGVTALVTVTVSDPGTAATGPVTANVTLPSGVGLLGLVGSSSWSCSPTSGGQSCSHGALGAGAAAKLSFNVLVDNLTGCGGSVVATATSGSLSATGASATTVQCAT